MKLRLPAPRHWVSRALRHVEPLPPVGRLALTGRLLQLFAGLALWGVAVALFVHSHLGLGPWDAFHYGLHVQTGLTLGMAAILFGVLVLAGTIALGVKPGLATLLNMIFIGVFIDLFLPLVPPAPSLAWEVGYLAAAIPLCGVASGLYIGAGFGHGPRDGLMVMLAVRSGWTVRRVRTLMEIVVLAAGWAMGGIVGIGTLVIAATIGPSVHWGLRLFSAEPRPVPVQRASPTRLRRRFRRAA
jgi:uncharacterized protein